MLRVCSRGIQALLGGLLPVLTVRNVYHPPEEVRQTKPPENTSDSGILDNRLPDSYSLFSPLDSKMKK